MTGSANLVLNNMGFVNNGNFMAGNGTVQLSGNTGAGITDNSVSGTTAVFNNLVTGLSSGDVSFNNDVTVNGSITMNGGNVQLNTHTLNLGSTGSIAGESDASHITSPSTGSITVTRSFNAGVAQNPGNIGAELLPNTAGSFTVQRQHFAQSLPVGQTSIQRSFTITGPSTPLFQLRFFYLNGELNGNDPSLVTLWSANTPGGSVLMLGKDGNDVNAAWVVLNGLSLPNQSRYFTLGNDPTGGGIIMPGGNSVKNKPVTASAGTGDIVNGAKLYPNPVHDDFVLNMVSQEPRQITISLIDASGITVQQNAIICVAGTNTITWIVNNIAAGIYYLHFSDPAFKNIRISKL